jgi:predicted Holliday junction resolvase-like endonuclease
MGGKQFAFCGNLLIFIMMMSVSIRTSGQTSLPEVLSKGTLKEQLDYINDKTRIYEEYRAIREDMFQKIKNNSADSLNGAKAVIAGLKGNIRARDVKIDSLKASLVSVKGDLDQMTQTKNSISLLGIEINKLAYNAVMWIIIAILAGALVIGFMVFKRNRIVTIHTKKEYEDLKKEFEAYRKASREAREKMSMAHFNELKKLRGA